MFELAELPGQGSLADERNRPVEFRGAQSSAVEKLFDDAEFPRAAEHRYRHFDRTNVKSFRYLFAHQISPYGHNCPYAAHLYVLYVSRLRA